MNRKTVLKTSLFAGVAILMSCQENGFLNEIDKEQGSYAYIEFSNYANKMTRASRVSGTTFVAGDKMAVWADQTTGTTQDVIFNNQEVAYDGTKWDYSPKKLWNTGSSYKFYGFYPMSSAITYAMDNDAATRYITVTDYVTPNAPADQTDLMISERISASPFNVVNMVFHHILSNVNMSVKVSDGVDMTGISSITLVSLQLKNIYSDGDYAQTGWSNELPVGEWSGHSSYMTISPIANQAITKTAVKVYSDYLMMPQMLFQTESRPKDVVADATFRIAYSDGTSSTYTKNGIRLAGINAKDSNNNDKVISEWEPNYVYNYTLAFNPQQTTRIWDADGDGSIQKDPATGNTITTTDDTPYPGTMKYNPDDPDHVLVYEDDPSTPEYDPQWNKYPVAWEDIDGDDNLEAGIDRDGDGHIDNVDGDNDTQQSPGGNTDTNPTDGNPNNPGGKDVILVHCDTDQDDDVDGDDGWVQVQKDKDTGVITPAREVEDAYIKFSATVSEWADTYTVNYDILN